MDGGLFKELKRTYWGLAGLIEHAARVSVTRHVAALLKEGACAREGLTFEVCRVLTATSSATCVRSSS